MACNVAPLCLFWTIRKDRNIRVFENVGLSNQELKFSFLCDLLEWSKQGLEQKPLSMLILSIGSVTNKGRISCFFLWCAVVYFLCIWHSTFWLFNQYCSFAHQKVRKLNNISNSNN